ncbi:MAG TPA: DUF4886 domain-containing protein [Polyangiaceae bacterium]|nr:DUF4886 domain-containing protein [Polyangiaceae bacterium]
MARARTGRLWLVGLFVGFACSEVQPGAGALPAPDGDPDAGAVVDDAGFVGDGAVDSGDAGLVEPAEDGGDGGDVEVLPTCEAGQVSAAVLPTTAWPLDADTVALYAMSNELDGGAGALHLSGDAEFVSPELDWSSAGGNTVARFSPSGPGLSRTGLVLGSEFTLEARVRWNGFRNRPCGEVTRILGLSRGGDGVFLEQPCGMASGAHVRVGEASELVSAAELDDVMDHQWHVVRLVISAGAVSFSIDGAQRGATAPLSSLDAADWSLVLGDYFDGEIDQVRLSSVARAVGTPAPNLVARPAYTELEGAASSATLTATIAGSGSVAWAVLSGPGDVVFDQPNALTTTATFCQPGKYVLQALAHEGDQVVDDYVVVRVWPEGGRTEPYKTLFVGNSFSFFNGTVAYRYWEFAKQAGEKVGDAFAGNPHVRLITSPGQNFRYHWFQNNENGECTDCPDHVLPAPPAVNLTDYAGSNAQDVVRDGDWDVVFLQNHSTAPATDVEGFVRYGKKLDRLIKQSGARTVFYQTWAYPGGSNTMSVEETILANYETLAAATGAALSPVGRCFRDVRENHDGYEAWPDGILYTDNYHPNSFGTYLAGAMHYATVYGKSPEGLLLYPGSGDIPAPEISTDTAKADLMRAIAAAHMP